MQYELAPTELLEVVDALLFRANALEQDKRELATDLRKLAMRFLGTSTRLKLIASLDAQALAHKPPTVDHVFAP
jgi:hypothetical protein